MLDAGKELRHSASSSFLITGLSTRKLKMNGDFSAE
jgi:hypothetical protein